MAIAWPMDPRPIHPRRRVGDIEEDMFVVKGIVVRDVLLTEECNSRLDICNESQGQMSGRAGL